MCYIFFSFLELPPLFLEVFVLFLSCIFSFLPIYENMFVRREFPWGGNCHRVPIHPTNNLGGSLYNILSLQLSLLQNPMNAGLYECPFHSKTSRHGNCCTHLKELCQKLYSFHFKGRVFRKFISQLGFSPISKLFSWLLYRVIQQD